MKLFNAKELISHIKHEYSVLEKKLRELEEYSLTSLKTSLEEAFPNVKWGIYYSYESTYEGHELDYLDQFRIVINSIDDYYYLSNGLVYGVDGGSYHTSQVSPYEITYKTPKVSLDELKDVVSKIEEKFSITIEIRIDDPERITKTYSNDY